MAVAIFLGKSTKMEYSYRNFDAKPWKFYSAYCQLKALPKFSVTTNSITQVSDGISNSDSSISTHESARGGGKGKKAATLEKKKKERKEKKRTREEEKEKKINNLIANVAEIRTIMKRKSASTILSKAIKTTTDEAAEKIGRKTYFYCIESRCIVV